MNDTVHVVFGDQSYDINLDRLDLDLDLDNASDREVTEAVERAMDWTPGALYGHVFDRGDMSLHPKATYG